MDTMCPMCQDILDNLDMMTPETIQFKLNEMDDTLRSMEYKIDGLEFEIESTVEEKISESISRISNDIKNIGDISSLKESIESREKNISMMQMKLLIEVQKVKEVITQFAEYIDPKKTINFRKEPDQKPKVMSEALQNIINNLEVKE